MAAARHLGHNYPALGEDIFAQSEHGRLSVLTPHRFPA